MGGGCASEFGGEDQRAIGLDVEEGLHAEKIRYHDELAGSSIPVDGGEGAVESRQDGGGPAMITRGHGREHVLEGFAHTHRHPGHDQQVPRGLFVDEANASDRGDDRQPPDDAGVHHHDLWFLVVAQSLRGEHAAHDGGAVRRAPAET